MYTKYDQSDYIDLSDIDLAVKAIQNIETYFNGDFKQYLEYGDKTFNSKITRLSNVLPVEVISQLKYLNHERNKVVHDGLKLSCRPYFIDVFIEVKNYFYIHLKYGKPPIIEQTEQVNQAPPQTPDPPLTGSDAIEQEFEGRMWGNVFIWIVGLVIFLRLYTWIGE